MPTEQKNFAVVTCHQAPHLFQRVVRILGVNGDLARIAFGREESEILMERVQPVSNIAFEVGDHVTCQSGTATIRDVIWHFRNRVPNYYLEMGGKQLSRRYLNEDLTPR